MGGGGCSAGHKSHVMCLCSTPSPFPSYHGLTCAPATLCAEVICDIANEHPVPVLPASSDWTTPFFSEWLSPLTSHEASVWAVLLLSLTVAFPSFIVASPAPHICCFFRCLVYLSDALALPWRSSSTASPLGSLPTAFPPDSNSLPLCFSGIAHYHTLAN